jgi:hypothetical protein
VRPGGREVLVDERDRGEADLAPDPLAAGLGLSPGGKSAFAAIFAGSPGLGADVHGYGHRGSYRRQVGDFDGVLVGGTDDVASGGRPLELNVGKEGARN